ncbi:MAG: NifU family protein [Micavibrio sp.]|nr:NifU family protein [Micavibrio sp.]
MFIQTEATPNPAVIKFLPGQEVLGNGSAEFKSAAKCEVSPLAQRLFRLQGVNSVFFGKDFVSITKADDTDWSMLKPMVLAALMEHLSTGQPVMLEQDIKAEDDDSDPVVYQIKELIAERVRPMVMMDGGDIEFDSFDDGIVYLRMKGACSGCPSATMTLKSGIENMLKHFIPEVVEVRPVEE